MEPPAALFELEGVGVDRGGRRLLGPVDLTIPADGPVAIIGPSGSGKTTLLRLLNRLEAPTSGAVRLRGDDLATLDPRALRRRVGMVFQQPAILPGTVADNLRAGRADLADAAIERLLAHVGLDAGLAERGARELSGGEAQRMALARALTTEPEVLLLDEPTSALDPASTARIEEAVVELQAAGTAVVWVTHDRAQLARVARHVVVLVDGRVDAAATGPVGGPT